MSRRTVFDQQAEAYAEARPAYPEQVYARLAECGLRSGARVLELGAGTGQVTAHLLARGAEVVAVEPGPRLATVLRRRLPVEALRVVVNDFETASLPAGPYDLAVSATAFHWLDPALALPKLASLLSPQGWLVVWWTVFADPQQPAGAFRVRLDTLYERHLPHEPVPSQRTPGPLRTESWSAELRRGGWFGPVDVDLIRWTHQMTPDSARRLWASFPNVAELEPAQREAFLRELAGIVEELGGTVDDPFVTALYRTQLTRRRSATTGSRS